MVFHLDKMAISAMLTMPPECDGGYSPLMQAYLKKVSQKKPVLLFSFPPKCGGTFLREAARVVVNGALLRSCYAQGGREAQFYLPTFLQYYLTDGMPLAVTHVHMQARSGNTRFIEALDLKPVTMIRAIPDMLVSLRDMFLNEAGMMNENVMCDVPEDFPQLSLQAQADFLAYIVAPWYVSYFSTWLSYARKNPERVLVLRFKDLRTRPVDLLMDALAHFGISESRECCEIAMKNVWQKRDGLRFNKGVTGRGHDFFSQAHFAHMERLLAQYPILADYQDELL